MRIKDADLGIVAISSNDAEKYPDDSPEKMKAFAAANGFSFPYLFDEDQSVAKMYKARARRTSSCTTNRVCWRIAGAWTLRDLATTSRTTARTCARRSTRCARRAAERADAEHRVQHQWKPGTSGVLRLIGERFSRAVDLLWFERG